MSACPCGSGKEFHICCQPYIDGKEKAPTAEALMRSRYTAYTKVTIEYITATHDPKTRNNHDPDQAREWAENSDWQGLEIIKTEAGGPADETGIVEFKARYRSDDEELEHHEVSEFRKEDGSWYFVDGKVVLPEPIRREEPKVGRNDPCPCGSGKKYKKCCG